MSANVTPNGPFETPILYLTGAQAGADINGKQYCAGKYVSGKIVPCTTAGENSVGPIQDKSCLANAALGVMFQGISKIKIGATAVVGGKPLTTDANGAYVHAASGDSVAGFAVHDAAANTFGTIALTPYVTPKLT